MKEFTKDEKQLFNSITSPYNAANIGLVRGEYKGKEVALIAWLEQDEAEGALRVSPLAVMIDEEMNKEIVIHGTTPITEKEAQRIALKKKDDTWVVDYGTFIKFRKAYEKAVTLAAEEFVFDGKQFVTAFAKYMLEYLQGEFKAQGEDAKVTLNQEM